VWVQVPPSALKRDKDLWQIVVSPFSLANGQTPTKPHHFFSPRRHSPSLPASPRSGNQPFGLARCSVEKEAARVTRWPPDAVVDLPLASRFGRVLILVGHPSRPTPRCKGRQEFILGATVDPAAALTLLKCRRGPGILGRLPPHPIRRHRVGGRSYEQMPVHQYRRYSHPPPLRPPLTAHLGAPMSTTPMW
jgi:hypothetical protein